MIFWITLALLLYGVWYTYSHRGDLLAGKALRLFKEGKNAEAIRIFRKAEKTGKMAVTNQINFAYTLLKSGFLDEARTTYNFASLSKKAKKDEKIVIKSQLALVEWKSGNLKVATEMLEEVFKTYKNSLIYQSLGLMYLLGPSKEKALEFCLEAYDYNSDDNVIVDNLAEAYILNGETEKAEALYEELMERKPAFPDAYFGYGMLLLNKGEKERALSLFDTALHKPFSFLSPITKEKVQAIYDANID